MKTNDSETMKSADLGGPYKKKMKSAGNLAISKIIYIGEATK
jgi:hypothetical protein